MARLLTAAAAAASSAAAAGSPSLSASCSSPVVSGTVPVIIDGVASDWAVLTSSPSLITVQPSGTFTVAHNSRGYLVAGCPQSFSAAAYSSARFPMVGTVMNYTVDLSTSGCGCNAAFYAVAMPAVNASGLPDPTECDDYYCDANSVCGVWCPEQDTMEANTAAFQVTPHKCDAPSANGFYPACDRDGCAVNSFKTSPTMYGPGPSFVINSLLPFTVSTAFRADPASGLLSSVTTTLTQGSGPVASAVLSHTDATCGAGYLESLTDAYSAGMVPTFSVWGDTGSTMQWLDAPPCSINTACDSATATMIIGNVSLTKL